MKMLKAVMASLAFVFCFGLFGACDWFAKDYEVTFMDDTKTLNTFKVNKGAKAAQPVDPTAPTFDLAFAGWYTSNDKNSGEAFDFNTEIKQNTTLYARWTSSYANDIPKSTIQFFTGATTAQQSDYVAGDDFDESLVTQENKVVLGYYLDSEFKIPFDPSQPLPLTDTDSDVCKIYVKYANKTATINKVTFKDGNAVLLVLNVENGNPIPAYVPSKYGYIFEGWYSDAAKTSAWSGNVTADTTLYAKFTQDESDSFFMTNEGTDGSVTLVGLTSKGKMATTLSIPENVTEISYTAFREAYSLTSLSIPATVTSIADKAFENCFALTEIFDASRILKQDAKWGFQNPKLTLVKTGETKLFTRGGVTYYFDKESNVKVALTVDKTKESISLDNGTTEINAYCFYKSSITSIEIPNSVLSIGKYAFNNCKSLTSVGFKNPKLEVIQDSAFSYCSNLTSINLPNSLSEIGKLAFANSGLSNVTGSTSGWVLQNANKTSFTMDAVNLRATRVGVKKGSATSTLKARANVMSTSNNSALVKFMYDGETTYQTFNVTKGGKVSKPSDPTNYGFDFKGWFDSESANEATQYFKNGQSETVNDNLTLFAKWTPNASNNEEFIVVRNTLKSVAESVRQRTEVRIPDGVKVIGQYAFGSQKDKASGKVQKLYIPDSVVEVDYSALEGIDASLKELYIGKGVQILRGENITYNEALEKIEVDSANPYFSSQDGVLYSKDKKVLYSYPTQKKGDSFTVPSGVTTIGGGAWGGWTADGEANLTNGNNTMAFTANPNLKFISLPDSVTKIESLSFSGCSNLQAVKLSSNLKSIGRGAFKDCFNLKCLSTTVNYSNGSSDLERKFTLPSGLESIGTDAFYCQAQQKTISGNYEPIDQVTILEITIPASVKFIDISAFRRIVDSIKFAHTDSTDPWSKYITERDSSYNYYWKNNGNESLAAGTNYASRFTSDGDLVNVRLTR